MINWEKINQKSIALDPQSSCDFIDPLEILLWGYCINRGLCLYVCPMINRIMFYSREEKKLKIEVDAWKLRQEVEKMSIRYDEIKRSCTLNATYHNWISFAKRPEVEPKFNEIIKELTLNPNLHE